MSDETVTPVTAPEPAAEQPIEAATPQAEPKAEDPKPEPDWRSAYVGLQRTVNKLHSRNEDLSRQNFDIAEALKTVKETTSLLARSSLGEEEVKALEARQAQASERAAALQAAQAAGQFVTASLGTLVKVMESAGVGAKDIEEVLLGAKQTSNVSEWAETVNALASAKIAKAKETELRKIEEGFRAKSQKEVQEEARALAERELKKSGVDQIDTGRGTATSSLSEKIRDMDPGSPEFARLVEMAKSGRLTRL